MKRVILPLLILLSQFCFSQQQKQPLSQDVYSTWNNIKNPILSHSGAYIMYEKVSYNNTHNLLLHNTINREKQNFPRGHQAVFSNNDKYLIYQLTASKDTIHSLKKAETKKEDFPKDTLVIVDLKDQTTRQFPFLKDYSYPDKGNDWIAIHFHEIPEEQDTTAKSDTTNIKKNKPSRKDKKKKDKNRPKCTNFLAFNILNNNSIFINDVSDYSINEYGNAIILNGNSGDSTIQSFIIWVDLKSATADTVFKKEGIIKNLAINNDGTAGTFIFSSDTTEKKIYSQYLYSNPTHSLELIADTSTQGMPANSCISEYHGSFFNEDGAILYTYTAPIPIEQPEDTLIDEERCSVDIWTWHDPLLQPMQKLKAKEEKNRAYLAAYILADKNLVQLADTEIPSIRVKTKSHGNYALGTSSIPYQQLTSWDGWYNDVYSVNINTGKKKQILTKHASHVSLSADENYILYWNNADSTWNTYNIVDEQYIYLTKDMDVAFYNEKHDTPSQPGPYRVVGWTNNDENIILSDYFDLWLFDPSMQQAPVNITNGYGRANGIRFSAVNLLVDEQFIQTDKNSFLLKGFDTKTKGSGYYSLNGKKDPKQLIKEEVKFGTAHKAKKSNLIYWTKQTFNQYPDLYVSNLNFNNIERISNANPQQSEYLWGNVELVSWTSDDGIELEGMLYTPENLDPEKKYPMLVYFYERNSDNLFSHRIPSPSRSIINPAYCTSNGYVVFVPDIVYETGHPGNNCYSAVVSGTQAMCNKFPFIDRTKLGLQGQSWGGYQIAMLVTQTDLFAAAMAGAPVSNMTSAYGGIRWGSGMSRAFQYEKSQSRIGKPLWEAPELYIENSPVFFADRVNTPLLIMHNDEDGAVPWYQGIEYFSALRRLQKPVWMLVYNGAPHNLSRWPDRMDLDKRMMQFFDHYLKDAPAPIWMTEGIPAIKKGIEKGFEITEP